MFFLEFIYFVFFLEFMFFGFVFGFYLFLCDILYYICAESGCSLKRDDRGRAVGALGAQLDVAGPEEPIENLTLLSLVLRNVDLTMDVDLTATWA